jgi:pyruvate dehydrogenase E1 component beta subunit
MSREIKCSEAICEGLMQAMAQDDSVYLIGQGVPDASQTYGTTKDIVKKYPNRVFDTPVSEAAMVGLMLGSSLVGLKPVMTMARFEFLLLAIDQLVNQAAKWNYTFGGKENISFTLRVIVGRGWGQGPQHSQSLHAWFAHVPGLKVVMPATAYDAKGLLMACIADPNPVLFIEHRWLHGLSGIVPESSYTVPIGTTNILKEGSDVTVVALSYATIDAIKAEKIVAKDGISIDLLNVTTLNPFDDRRILASVKKTGRLIVCDYACATGSFASEIISRVAQKAFSALKSPPIKIALPDLPLATTRALANFYYPTDIHIANAIKKVLGIMGRDYPLSINETDYLDVPDASYTGPF